MKSKPIFKMNSVMILLWLTIFLEFTTAQNEILRCTIRDGENEIHLELKRTEQFLANKHLPVWTAIGRKRPHCQRRDHASHQLHSDLMNDIGEFIFYHDKDKSSAVVLFLETNTLAGAIDTRYSIMGIPLHECGSVVEVGGPYVKHIESPSMNVESHLKALDLSIRRNEESITFQDDSPTHVTTLYPEIMVFLPYDKIRTVKIQHPNMYVGFTVIQTLIFFNVIDMVLSKLWTDNIKIYLNLAGIVIEDRENVFDFIKFHYKDGFSYLNADETLESFSEYGTLNRHIFPQDSFDFFFIPTSRLLWSSDCSGAVEGLAMVTNSFSTRRERKISRYWAGATVKYLSGFEYITASHEIAHLMGIKHDQSNKGCCSRTGQCYAIMQTINAYCPDCLRWSDESYEDLKKFVRDNRDHCFLLNKPRSLHPYNSRIKTLTPSEQCRCYGFEPMMTTIENELLDVVPHGDCGRSLKCHGSPEGFSLPLPIDGTPCSENGLCWNKKCQMNENIAN